MSYILDALRKAERERRSGRVPTLDAHHPLKQATRRPVWTWVLGVALLVNAAVLGVYWRSGSRLVPPTAGHPDARPAGPAAAAAPSRSTPVSRPEPATAPPVAPAPPASGLDRSAAVPVTPRSEPSDRGDRAAPAAPAVTTGVTGRPASGDSPPIQTLEEPRPGVAVADNPQRGARPVTTAATPAPVPAESRPPPAPAPAGDSAGARESVAPGAPPALTGLSLEVLVYSAERAERLVFINGRKYVEGQAIEGGFVIEAITAAGAIVSGEGQRFLLRPRLNPYVRP